MPAITFVSADGDRTTVTAKDGESVMEAARTNNIAGITAECGGAMACATCHVYVAAEWSDKVGPASDPEAEMLEFAACEPSETSRLSCQITLGPELDGLVVHLPEAQV